MHTDITGLIDLPGLNGEKYGQMLVDDYSGAIWVSTMEKSSGAGDATRDMVLHAQKVSGKKVITVRPDVAKELTEGKVKEFLDGNVTLIDPIPPYSPQSNGRVERPNKTIYEKARTILSELNMVCSFEGYNTLWPEALKCVVHIYIRTLTRSTHKDVRNKTPYEILTGEKPDLFHVRIFGLKFKVLKPKSYREGKVGPKVWDGVHVDYNPGGAYCEYLPELKRYSY